MENITTNLHSFVDVITNSSTMVYISADKSSIDSVKNFINKILKISNSDKTADDLFEFEVQYDKYLKEDYEYEIKQHYSNNDKIPTFEEWIDNREYDYYSSTILMKPKTGDQTVIDLQNEFTNIFSVNAQADY